MKKSLSLLTFVALISLFLTVSLASAAVQIVEVELDEDTLSSSGNNFVRAAERDEEFNVKVHMSADSYMDYVTAEVSITGDRHNDRIGEVSEFFDLEPNVTRVEKLRLRLTDRMEQDTYVLRVRVCDRANPCVEETYPLRIELPEHQVRVDDIILTPAGNVKAGRALLVSVRVENRGERDEDGVKVIAEIPELGLSGADFVDELDPEDFDDDQATSEEIFLQIPECAEPGLYRVVVTVEYDDRDRTTTRETSINVIENDACTLTGTAPAPVEPTPAPVEPEKTLVTVGMQAQNAKVGAQPVMYPFTVANLGSSSKVYMVSVSGLEQQATTRVVPTNTLILNPGESRTVFVQVAPNANAAEGQFSFTSMIASSDGKVQQQVPLSVTIEKGSELTLRNLLLAALIILIVILVIVGVIISFGRRDKDEEEAYY